jgi:hypothetical protein
MRALKSCEMVNNISLKRWRHNLQTRCGVLSGNGLTVIKVWGRDNLANFHRYKFKTTTKILLIKITHNRTYINHPSTDASAVTAELKQGRIRTAYQQKGLHPTPLLGGTSPSVFRAQQQEVLRRPKNCWNLGTAVTAVAQPLAMVNSLT